MSPGFSVWLIYTQMWFIIIIYDSFSAGLSLSQLWNSLLFLLWAVYSEQYKFGDFSKAVK